MKMSNDIAAWTQRVRGLVRVVIIMFFVRLNHDDICKLFDFFDIISKCHAIIFYSTFINQVASPIKTSV